MSEVVPRQRQPEPRDGTLTSREADWRGLRALVVGLGRSGFAAATALEEQGAAVTVVSRDSNPAIEEHRRILDVLDVPVLIGPEHMADVPEGTELVVTSPGVPPYDPLLRRAQERGIPVWGEVELAWRMRSGDDPAPWLVVTGTNGKTTTVQMLAHILTTAGLRAMAAGNVGTPIIEAVLDPTPYDVLAVELSTFQLHWQSSIAPDVSCCLNVAPDHIDWHGSMEAYTQAKGLVYENTKLACVYNVEDPVTEELVREADVQEGCRAIGFTLGVPGLSMIGLVEDLIADRAFTQDRQTSALELASLADLAIDGQPPAPHYVANALAASAMARAVAIPPASIREALSTFRPDAHRIQFVGEIDGVRFVDDSKATNTAAAAASLAAYPSIVWVAGGQLKGQDVDELVAGAVPRLRGAVLIGADREQIADALRRHAPDLPVISLDAGETGVMDASQATPVMARVIDTALDLAQAGDVVLLAPAAASKDMFISYEVRGSAFAAAVTARRDRDVTGGGA